MAVCGYLAVYPVLLIAGCACFAAASTGGRSLHSLEFLRRYDTLHMRTHVDGAVRRSRRDAATHDTVVNVELSALDKTFVLLLQPQKKLFTETARIRLIGDGGSVKYHPIDRSMFFIGRVAGQSTSFVHGVIKDGLFHGVIRSEGRVYHVEPSTLFLKASPSGHDTIVYEESDISYPHPVNHTCPAGVSQRLRDIQASAEPRSPRTPLDQHLHLRRRKRAFDEERKTCRVAVVADYTFFHVAMNDDEAEAVAEMTFHINEASNIFITTEFDIPDIGPGVKGVNFQIDSVDVYTTENNPLAGEFGTDEMLTKFSTQTFDSVCLAHLFLHRDFSNGVLGLAWVASPGGSVGGICQKRTRTAQGDLNLNTGFTTVFNFNNRVPRSVSSITTTHEFGHNFGSPHDSGSTCAPGGDDGNYIMYASATDGSKQNNRLFSACSRASISSVLANKATCFDVRREDSICGNGLREGTEECDCGSDQPAECAANDPCCRPGNCTLLPGSQCSAKWDVCCVLDAGVCRLAGTEKVCTQTDECQLEQRCDGQNKTCPARVTLPDGTYCNGNLSTCEDGACSGSLCGVYGWEACECTDEGKECHLCCTVNTLCTSLRDLNSTLNITTGVYLPGNAPCKDFTGYCLNEKGEVRCVTVNDQDPLDDLKKVFDTISVSSILDWLKEHWPETLGGFGGAIVLFILLRVTYRPKKLEESRRDRGRDRDESVPLLSRRS